MHTKPSKVTETLAEVIDAYLESVHEAPVTVSAGPQEVREHLKRYDFAQPMDARELIDDVTDMLWKWTEHAGHPMHFGLFRPATDRIAVVADALAALYDPNLATYQFSPAAHEMERHVLQTLADCFGFDLSDGLAHFTSGGQEANHTAVAVALTARFPETASRGLRALCGQPVFYVSEEGHHSLDKVAHSTGLGRRARREVPAGSDLRMDVAALARMVREDRAEGRLPFLVAATAGTTNAGIVDPLPQLADFARREELWLHVDAAWGGAAAVSERLRPVLAGIEQADSITCDAHKWLSVPVGAGMFFSRHRDPVERTFATHAAYVPPHVRDGRVYPYTQSMQWSRRFIGLRLFLRLAEQGLPGIARQIEHQAAMGDLLRAQLGSSGWTILNPTPLPVVCFGRDGLDAEAHARIVERLRRDCSAWISKTVLRGQAPALRACICNYRTEPGHIERLVALVDAAAREEGVSG